MCPIYVFHGDDDFTIAEALAELKQDLGPAELRDANLATLSAGATSYEEVIAAGSTVPFMTPARMVVVEGLLATFEGGGPRRAGRSRAGAAKESAGPWAQLPDAAAGLPPTTILVFRDGPLRDGNPLLQLLKPVATVRRFSPLQREDLRLWVGERMARKGGAMSDKGARLLMELVGGNLWALDAELEKLQLYAGERPVSEDDVGLLVSRAREANIFAAVDAMVEGRQAAALRELQRLLADGGGGALHTDDDCAAGAAGAAGAVPEGAAHGRAGAVEEAGRFVSVCLAEGAGAVSAVHDSQADGALPAALGRRHRDQDGRGRSRKRPGTARDGRVEGWALAVVPVDVGARPHPLIPRNPQ